MKVDAICCNIMEHILFIAKDPTDNYKITKRMNKIQTTTPATIKSMSRINEFTNKNICTNLTTHLVYNKNKWRTPRQSLSTNKLSNFINVTITTHAIKCIKQHMSFGFARNHFWLMFWLLMLSLQYVQSFGMATSKESDETSKSTSSKLYSQLISTNGQISATMENGDETFRPFIPKAPQIISHAAFPLSGPPPPFKPFNINFLLPLRHNETARMSKLFNSSATHKKTEEPINQKNSIEYNKNIHEAMVHQKNSSNLSFTKHHSKVKRTHEFTRKHEQGREHEHLNKQPLNFQQNEISRQDDLTSDLRSLEDLLVDYATNFFQKGHYEPTPGLLVELQRNSSQPLTGKTRSLRQTTATEANIKIDLPRSLATGRLLFLTGLKKVLWPVFMGLQVLKSLLIAMFIPALIASFTKLLGKGITTGSAPLFIRPMEPPQELDFRDNTFNFDDDNKFMMANEGTKDNSPYAYNHLDAAQINNEYVFDPSSSNNQLSYTRLGMNERQQQLMQDSYMNALQSIGSASFKNSGSLSSGSSGLLAPMAKRPPPAANVNTFQQFQNVPDSSLLLSNYDPFYSPLLSRLDSVFAQLKINSDKEMCREKLICLMYANPAKYAPYSNLVSAQLSRELNELRKPTSDNPDILRFFKYMRAAKDGQDGVDCEKTFDKCTEFKDFENPAMVSTYNDINKLVQARKFK